MIRDMCCPPEGKQQKVMELTCLSLFYVTTTKTYVQCFSPLKQSAANIRCNIYVVKNKFPYLGKNLFIIKYISQQIIKSRQLFYLSVRYLAQKAQKRVYFCARYSFSPLSRNRQEGHSPHPPFIP